MSFGSFDSSRSQNQGTVSEINMVPLIDVMLVLLVIFIITAPLLAHSIKIDVPQVSSQAINQDPKAVDIAVDAQGFIFVNESPMDLDNLREYFINTAKQEPTTEFRIRADANTRYELIAKIMAAAKGSGVKRLGFITSPAPESAASSVEKPSSGTVISEASSAATPAAVSTNNANTPASRTGVVGGN